MRGRTTLILLGLLGLVALFAGWSETSRTVLGPHDRSELARLRNFRDTLPVAGGDFFLTSGRCAGCHGRDLLGQASIDPATGHDVNVVNDWRSSIMANSARDPFYLAKLDHEMLVNPGHAEAIGTKCLSCHAPLAVYEEALSGHPPFTRAMLDTSVLASDGVSCLACHMQSTEFTGSTFSGVLHFDSAHVYGPYYDDQINPNIMQSFVGFTPGFGEHIVNSEVCAGCHTLITETLDLDGNLTGDEFVEQATYHEWQNSVYNANGTQCITCHMPRIEGPIILAAEYAFLNGQTPFGLHHLAGANVHMLELMKANREALRIPATEAQFDSTIARTRALLTQRSLDIDVDIVERTADTAYFEVRLENRAGHRFPSGYPSRRAFVEFIVRNADGDTVFASGLIDDTYEVVGHDAAFEPHYDVITSEDQVQIYELVMADVNGDFTTVLERAKEPLKDNRLVPLGFLTSHPGYDTTRIAGTALLDPNFNRNTLNEEGSGTDLIHYRIPMNGWSGALTATTRVFYQSMPPAWNAEMFAYNSATIDTFRTMLAASDGTPTLVVTGEVGVGPLGLKERAAERIAAFPDPTSDGWMTILPKSDARIRITALYDARGRAVPVHQERKGSGWRIQLPATGIYFLYLTVNDEPVLQRVIRQ